MELIDVYENIENPLNDPLVISKIVEAYSRGGDFLKELTKSTRKEQGKINQEYKDKLYALLFNTWKNTLVKMNRATFIEGRRKGYFDNEIARLRILLKDFPDANSYQDTLNFFTVEYEEQKDKNIIEKYRFDRVGSTSGWTQICSKYITLKQTDNIAQEHSLFINASLNEMHEFIYLFIVKCISKNLPYYLKFDEGGLREDSIVIYTSTNKIIEYLNVLMELKNENPNLILRLNTPPALSGKIGPWIGYGKEPQQIENDIKQSFFSIRAKSFEKIIEKATIKSIIDNLDLELTNNQGQKTKVGSIIAYRLAGKVTEELKTKYEQEEMKQRGIALEQGKTYNPQIVPETLGYSKEDMQNEKTKVKLGQIIEKNIGKLLIEFYNGSNEKQYIALKNGKRIEFQTDYLRLVIIDSSYSMMQIDKKYQTRIKEEAEKELKKYKIDSSKICFDTTVTTLFKKKVKKQELINKEELPKTKPIMPVKKEINSTVSVLNRTKKIKEEQKSSVEQKNITIETLPKVPQVVEKSLDGKVVQKNNRNPLKVPTNENLRSIGPKELEILIQNEVKEQTMPLPNGNNVTINEYLENAVFNHLPQNGIILINGEKPKPVRKFIKEYILGECKEKYNGDFPRYLAERLRSNLGVISFVKDNTTYDIAPERITEFIDSKEINKLVKLPNGSFVTAKDYIQVLYAPHIPQNGLVTLTNGTKVTVKNYITNILLKEGQTKYNGDIGRILFYTTRQNQGTINLDPVCIKQSFIAYQRQIDLLNQNGTNAK